MPTVTLPVECRSPARYRNSVRMECRFAYVPMCLCAYVRIYSQSMSHCEYTTSVKSRAIWLTNRAISYTGAGEVPVPGTQTGTPFWPSSGNVPGTGTPPALALS